MAESGTGEPQKSDIEESVIRAASYIVNTSSEMQKWSGALDWSRRLTQEGTIKTPTIIRAFSKVKRRDFLPDNIKADEGYDRPLHIGSQQTNSQPTIVGEMLELLGVKRGHAVLDVGAGSGWSTALLAEIVGTTGKVVGTEVRPEIAQFGQANLAKYNYPWAKIEQTESGLGFPSGGPYNRILVSAHMLEDWVPELTEQLSPRGGVMVAPIVSNTEYGSNQFNQSLSVITRLGANCMTEVAINNVGFVPLVHESKRVN